MAHYLVRADLIESRRDELAAHLDAGDFQDLRPFGKALTYSLNRARLDPSTGEAVWEEEDYCRPPLAQERAAVLDDYFENLSVEKVPCGEGWERIRELPFLWDRSPKSILSGLYC